MLRFLVTGLLMAMPLTALAQDRLPNLYDVTVVETWDKLNVRAAPDGKAKIIGRLSSTAKGIELVGRDASGKWGRVNVDEQSGWVALRFLKPHESVWKAASLPLSLTCSGTEPFWSLAYDPARRNMTLSQMGDENGPLGLWIDWHLSSSSRSGQIGWAIEGPARRGFATLTAEACNDGMSDRSYGLSISLFVNPSQESSAEPVALSGCCSLAP